MTELEELKQQVKELQNRISQLEKQQDTNWKPVLTKLYFYITDTATVESHTFTNSPEDKLRISINNCFQTAEQAIKHVTNLQIKSKLKDLANELNHGEVIDWKNFKQHKYYIYYDHEANTLDYTRNTAYQKQGIIYCLNSNFLHEAIDRIGASNLINMIKGGV